MRSLLVFLLLCHSAYAQTERLLDKSNNLIGTVRQEGSRLVERNKSGDMQGYWQREGGYWVHRNKAGDLISRSQIQH